MDSLAVSYASELTLWGIETSIVVPGAFTKGTNHFAHAGAPSDAPFGKRPFRVHVDPSQDGEESSTVSQIACGLKCSGASASSTCCTRPSRASRDIEHIRLEARTASACARLSYFPVGFNCCRCAFPAIS
jgi:hypothetical protein